MKANTRFSLLIGRPALAGLYGYAIFFTVLLLCKWIGCMIDSSNGFNVAVEDLLIAIIGFVLLFVIRLLENFQKSGAKEGVFVKE